MTTRFQLLPEWAEQAAVLMAWPHACTDWQPWLHAIDEDYAALAIAIAGEVPPLILCQDPAHQAHIESLLAQRCAHAPRFLIQPYNDTWCRDYGPITLADGGSPDRAKMRLLDFCFNGWGDKYDASLDNNINQALQSLWQAPMSSIDFELEGGSIETDGQGTLLTTEHCLLDSNRNQHLSRQQIETLVLEKLGLDRALWLSEGALIGDDTDSHIDNLARFTGPDTIVYASCGDEQDPHFAPLAAMARQLQGFRQANGAPYRLVPIGLPSPQFDEAGKRLPGSYINFLILNRSVIVPVFGCDHDQPALDSLQLCFPHKKIVAVPGHNLIKQYGGPHCATMQLPKGVIA
ncbi:MAG: agmatine deiminase [Pseudomonadales bacterium]|jgi:agmatine deiminase|uniref:agmatine deiminase family protein n=1 Tax=unclassified Ketobacter TaxID=2639109 RepID=UPI000C96C961|nr:MULTISPECIES: agmatine deiminase family protein [unclassified Ketobacter]MAQ26262.1 agmatine deiminase [Pseudomonadales bacterium]MEC8809952.1 agmatine deiminase family protein [Pseudomonadota bacterium]TNC90378.1 MAG: agmatine deiminase [Alcanivorax sp.]HAG96554.1 agmatine deiminase [Gammaproteobacteria bacterium]MCK5791920.1 agmatine deiminase family protein [Ketobacter sp.]|tara:strand:- start:34550 stop:35590 length:1041 start_codon:yes stop_codon:yes gene_type:complete